MHLRRLALTIAAAATVAVAPAAFAATANAATIPAAVTCQEVLPLAGTALGLGGCSSSEGTALDVGADFNALFLVQQGSGLTYYCADGGVYGASLTLVGLNCILI